MSVPLADARMEAVLKRLARLEAVAVVLVEREQLRRNPVGPYDDVIKRSDDDNKSIQSFMEGLLAMSQGAEDS